MSKNTAPQAVPVQTETTEKKAKKPLFGLSQEELKMVHGGGGIIIGKPQLP
jgi:hypothetical protein